MTKKILLILYILLITIVESNAQQYWINKGRIANQNLYNCSFTDTLNGWASGDSGMIVHTSDGGLHWIQQNSKIRNFIQSINFISNRCGWALAWDYGTIFYGTYVLRTTDGGINWDTTSFPVKDVFLRNILFVDSLTGYVGGGPNTLAKSTDGGVTWIDCAVDTSTVASRFPIWKIRFSENKNFGIAGGGVMDIAGVIWKTTNQGAYWNSKIVSSEPINDVKIFDSLNILGLAGDFEFGSSLIKTSNGGENWIYKNLGVFGIPKSLSFRDINEGWAPMGYSMNFLTTFNGGQDWVVIDTPDSLKIFDIVFLNNKCGYGVGVDGSFIKYNCAVINIGNISSVPFRANLKQNYPNPFNPVTKIEYSIKTISDVEISVYNMLGQKLNTLFKGVKPEGLYAINFDGNNIPSGIYFYCLKTKDLKTGITDIKTKKMILIK